MRALLHYLTILFYFIVIFCLIFVNGSLEDGSADDYFEPSFRIEPTPVFVQGRSSSYYKIGWPPDLPKELEHSWHEGSGREKREYNLEDFLVWVPSGDGSPDEWNQKPENKEWIRPYTKTVFVTKTKYETLVLPTNVDAYPTVKDTFPTKSTTNNFGKDIYGNFGKDFESGCKMSPFFHPFGSTFSLQNDQGITSKPNDFINASTPVPKGQAPEFTPFTKAIHPDIRDFLHPSLGYEGPFSTFHHPQTTSYPTPSLPTRVKDFDVSGTTFVSISSTKDFAMHSTHLVVPSTFIPKTPTLSSHFTVSTTLYSTTTDFHETSKTYDTTISSKKQTQEFSSPVFDIFHTVKSEITSESPRHFTHTVYYNNSTEKTVFSTPFSSVTNATGLFLFNSTIVPVTSSIEQSTNILLETTTMVTPIFGDIDNATSTSDNKTSCNCSTSVKTSTSANKITANEMSEKGYSINLPTLPENTLSIPSVFPSPSNNGTTPINKSHWVRSTLIGPPFTSNKLEFKNEITRKLTKVYRYAYKVSLVENSSDYNIAALLRHRKIESIILTTDGSVSINRYRRSVAPFSPKIFFTNTKFSANQTRNKTIVRRVRRQTTEEISVRIQNITYMAEPNITEIVYSVFKGDMPVKAIDAVAKMNSLNDTVVENYLGYPLEIVAEEYLQSEKFQESKKNDAIVFGSIIGGVALLIIIVIVAASLLYNKKCKNKHKQSTDNLGDGSEGYYHRSHTDTDGGRDNLGFAEMHDEESTPEDGDSRSSHSAMDSHSSRPSFSQEPVAYPRTKSAEELEYAVVDRRAKPNEDRSTSPEHEYSTPKPISQIRTNIQIGLDNATDNKKFGEYIPGTSLPRFLPPPRQVLASSPSLEHRPQILPRNYYLDESDLTKPGTSQDRPVVTGVQERPSLDRSMSGLSRGSSELEISPNSPSIGSGVGIGRLRRRFHDLLDDAFSLMNGQKPGDKVTPLATPHRIRNSRARSAMPLRRPCLLDDLEGGMSRTLTPERPHVSLRPWSAAAVIHSPRDMISILPSGDSAEGSPRSAWGDHGRSITPVNLPNQRSYDRPDSAPIPRMVTEGLRSPTPIDPETGLRMHDPAVPLIRAIKEELNRFKASVNTDSSNA